MRFLCTFQQVRAAPCSRSGAGSQCSVLRRALQVGCVSSGLGCYSRLQVAPNLLYLSLCAPGAGGCPGHVVTGPERSANANADRARAPACASVAQASPSAVAAVTRHSKQPRYSAACPSLGDRTDGRWCHQPFHIG